MSLFPNYKRLSGSGSMLSTLKLMLAVGTTSRPQYKNVFLALLRPFTKDGEITVRYNCYERSYQTLLRVSDLSADCESTRELSTTDVYRLDRGFDPDVVIDGGGNIGLFTLRVAAAVKPGRSKPVRLAVYEPLPRNIEQIKKHLAMNGVKAETVAVCLGGVPGSIPFYCRGANQSSFESREAYDSVIDIPVVRLQDAVGDSPAERILIKLDIEGMEVEALGAFLPQEKRAVYVVGELHDLPKNGPLMDELFRKHGWMLELFDVDTETATFRGCSPAAAPLLEWAREQPAATVKV